MSLIYASPSHHRNNFSLISSSFCIQPGEVKFGLEYLFFITEFYIPYEGFIFFWKSRFLKFIAILLKTISYRNLNNGDIMFILPFIHFLQTCRCLMLHQWKDCLSWTAWKYHVLHSYLLLSSYCQFVIHCSMYSL